jgi:tetratricopeptide (TPR) repeat protein
MLAYAIYRVYQFIQAYPSHLVTWLVDRVKMLFTQQQYATIIRDVQTYLPRIIYFRGLTHIDTCACKHFLAKALLNTGELNPAQTLLEEVLHAYEPYGEDNHMALVYEDLGLVYYHSDDFSESLRCLLIALKIFTEQYEINRMIIAEDGEDDGSADLANASSVSVLRCNSENSLLQTNALLHASNAFLPSPSTYTSPYPYRNHLSSHSAQGLYGNQSPLDASIDVVMDELNNMTTPHSRVGFNEQQHQDSYKRCLEDAFLSSPGDISQALHELECMLEDKVELPSKPYHR